MPPHPDKAQTAALPQGLLAGGLWTFGGRVCGALAAFAVNVLAARLAPPQDVGAYFLAVSTTMSASLVVALGLSVVVVHRVAAALAVGDAGEVRAVITGCLRVTALSAVAGAIVLGVAAIAGAGMPGFSMLASMLLLIWMVLLTLLSLLAESFRGMHDYRLAAIFGNTLSAVFLLAALMVAVAAGLSLNLEQLLACSVGAVALSVLSAGLLIAYRLQNMPAGRAVTAASLIGEGLPLMLGAIATFVVTQADLWIVGTCLPPEETAAYGAAGRLLQFVMMPMLIANAVVAPAMARLYGRREYAGMQRIAGAAGAVSGLLALAILVVFVCLAGSVLGAMFGEHYRRAAQALVILGAGQTINALSGPGAVMLMMSGHARAVMAISLLCAGALVAGGLVLVGDFGIDGVAACAAGATAAHGLLSMLWARRQLGVWASISPGGIGVACAAANRLLHMRQARSAGPG